jgi:hypothetical protein
LIVWSVKFSSNGNLHTFNVKLAYMITLNFSLSSRPA